MIIGDLRDPSSYYVVVTKWAAGSCGTEDVLLDLHRPVLHLLRQALLRRVHLVRDVLLLLARVRADVVRELPHFQRQVRRLLGPSRRRASKL